MIMALESANPVKSIEENTYKDNKTENSINILETLSSNEDESSKIVNKLTLNKLIESLEFREKEIIVLRYYKEKTQTEIARILGISQVQVSRLEKKILEKMKKELVAN